MTNIYVANIPYSATNDDLREAFERYGKVSSAKIITNRETGDSRGFGFVEMEDDGHARTAIETLNGADFMGRELKVNVARERR